MTLRLIAIAILLAISVFAQQSPITIYIPTGTVPVTQISGCTGSGPTVCTTITDHGLIAGDTVLVYMIVEHAGNANQLSAINAPAGSARKVGSAGLTHNTLSLTDLNGNPLNTSNTVLLYSGFIRKAAASTLNLGPRVGLDGTGGPVQMAVSATIMDATLTNITVSGGGLATVNYAYPHGLTSGNQIQVRNASLVALNGIHTATVISPTAATYSVAAASAGTYTDANLGVSSRALDGQPAWEKIKSYTGFADSTHVNFVYQASQAQPSFGNCAAAAYYWYVDRSQTAMHDFAMGCVDRVEDFYPGPEFCREDLGPYCPVGNGNTRTQASDYVRIEVTNAATLYTLMRPQLSTAQKQRFRNYFLNDVSDGCTHPSWLQGPGTMSSSGTAITGLGTSFPTSFHVGDYLFAWDSPSQEEAARVVSITDDSHMVVTGNFPTFPGGSPYWIVPAFQSAAAGGGSACGLVNFYSHHVASTATRDARLYVQPAPTGTVDGAGYLPPAGDWITAQGNNQEVTATFASISIASALAEDDTRALRLLGELGAWDYDYLGGEIVGTWGGLLKSGPYYGLGRTVVWDIGTLKIGQRSIANFPDITAAPHNNGPKSQLYNYLYSHLPQSSGNDPWFSPWSYLGGELSLSTQFTSLATLGAVVGGAEGQYMRYFLANHATTWANGGSDYTEAPLLMALLDPNAPAAASYTSLPLQIQLASTDATYCSSLGLTCSNGSPNFVQSNMARGAVISRTGWTGSATVFSQTNLGGSMDVAGNPEDHGATIPGNYHLIKGSTSGLGGCLIGDNDNSCVFGNGPGYGTGELTATTSLAAGTNMKVSSGGSNVLFGPVLSRWSGPDKFGDPASRYAASTWELASYYAASEGVNRAQRNYAHFKKPGTDEFILIYDDVAKTTGTKIAGYTQYPQGAPAGCCTSGSTSFSGGILTTTNPDGFRVLTRWLAPSGGTSLAVLGDGTAYAGSQGDTMAYRVTHCASVDGASCSTAATGMEAIQAHYVTTSSQSGFTATLLSPDSNWTGAQVTGAAGVKIALWARHGILQSTMTSFSPAYSGIAQILMSGLTPGTYSVTVGGTAVSESPFTVTTGDNSIYFETSAGAIAISGTASAGGAGSPSGGSGSTPPGGGGTTSSGGAQWAINGGNWTSRKQLMISHAQVSGSSTISNFAMLFSSNDPSFRNAANGGVMGRSDGKDLFFTDANGTKLNHELVSFDGTAGKVVAWVQVPTISSTADTVLFAYFGNSSSADQQNPTGTWDANYKGVWHLPDGTRQATDSTANSAALTSFGAQPAVGPGGGGINLNGNEQFVSAPMSGSSMPQFTVEYWVKSVSGPANQEGQFEWAAAGCPMAGDPYLLLAQDSSNQLHMYFDAGYRLQYAMPAETWNHVVVTWDENHAATLYVNGVSQGSYTSSAMPAYQTNAQLLYFGSGYSTSFTGSEAEARVSSIARGANWIRTEYNNQSSPGSFYSLGSTETPPASTPAPGPPDLTVTFGAAPVLNQGQSGATFALTALNVGSGPTTAAVAVSVTVPTGLTAAAIGGNGWTCMQPSGPCTRSDSLSTGGSYPAISLLVNVAPNAPSSVSISTSVSNGGETNTSNDTATALITIKPTGTPALRITSSHSGSFTQGEIGATYSIAVANSGSAPTNGLVTVVDTVPPGLTATSISGFGWNCTPAPFSCTRSDALAAGASYPTMKLTVNVSTTAASQVTNQVSVSGGGASLVMAGDLTSIMASAPAGWTINGGVWVRRKQITISQSQAASTTLSNFQMLVSSVDADLRSTASGGFVGRTDGKDIFFTDSLGAKLNHELVNYDGSAGKVVAWVEVPILSPGAAATIYVYFGNSSSKDQQNVTGTWDSTYRGVWHFSATSSVPLNDSTSNGINLMNESAMIAAGPLGGDLVLNGSSQYAVGSLAGSAVSQFTVEYWVDSARTPVGQEGQFEWAEGGCPMAGDPFLLLAQDSSNNLLLYFDAGYRTKYPMPAGIWNHVVVTWDSNHVATLYVNGVSQGVYTSSATPALQSNAQFLYFGSGYPTGFVGSEAEARVSNIARSADWVRMEYKNQSSPGSFYILGPSQVAEAQP